MRASLIVLVFISACGEPPTRALEGATVSAAAPPVSACGYVKHTSRACPGAVFVYEYSDSSRCEVGKAKQLCEADGNLSGSSQSGDCHETWTYETVVFDGTCDDWSAYGPTATLFAPIVFAFSA